MYERKAVELNSVSSTSRKKSWDKLSSDSATGHYGNVASPVSARWSSIQSKLNGSCPLSSNSNEENTRGYRHQGSQGTVNTFCRPDNIASRKDDETDSGGSRLFSTSIAYESRTQSDNQSQPNTTHQLQAMKYDFLLVMYQPKRLYLGYCRQSQQSNQLSL
ncbi:hypothetical protein B9Z19DRAFT_1148955 [Tuber borchii]|uniref:Uncharacterized protein n=1 Tax=Tuber borchii TaxID=42251 RepID=A0A2T6ZMC4_TUBBO|nr:hypothetical protein B9Z19DRAFT_1148955 [Tuber borchii]